MAADSNMGSHQANTPSSFHHPRMVSFRSGATDSLMGVIPGNSIMVPSAASCMTNHMDTVTQSRYPAGSVLREPKPRFTHVSGSPAYWSSEEVDMLSIGLLKYANEPNIRKYAKIAAMLPQKTIRDVALRCQWMINKENGKRRKMEEYYAAKKMKEMKDQMVGSPSTANICMAPISFIMNHKNIHDQLPSEEMRCLLDENGRFLKDIARNLEGGMIEENINLFHYIRNNISTIENRVDVMSATMNQLPGSMTQMPLWTVSVNDDLLSSLIPLNGNNLCATPGSNQLRLDMTCFRRNIG
ncbi:uncharacterized protein LOC103977307 isoform X1 [Musa acuminata AAA Group]|uniref:uncharacterized protein LOC103977307 isoform X1 n=1 Tax=Musa acuminata AAA Group TaxID=214697 RepID=UPI0031D8920E